MTDPFEVTMPGKVLFGSGTVSKLGAETKPFASKILLVCGSSPSRAREALDSLRSSGVETVSMSVRSEPTVDCVREGAKLARINNCLGVVAVGGGSVLDAGKAIAAMAANQGDLLDYLEVIGKGHALSNSPLFFAAVPTTAGTGTEATRNAVLTSPEHKVKVSLRHPSMVPRVVVLDPRLTLTVPPEVTATTGMDALCQLLESYTCRTPNPFTDVLCKEGMARAVRSLSKAFLDGSDLQAREDMVLASHFSGIALANAKLGAVHGFAAPLGGMYGAAHGGICAALLPAVTDMNLKALAQRQPSHPALKRYQEAAVILTGKSQARAEDGVELCEKLRKELKIPRLSELGVKRGDFGLIRDKASKASSMKGNPVELSLEELGEILEKAF